MNNNRGQALMHVLVAIVIIMSVAVAMLDWTFYAHSQQMKSARRTLSHANLEGVRAKMWSCLQSTSYPSVSCTPSSAAELACIPSSIVVDGKTYALNTMFSGSRPLCKISIEVGALPTTPIGVVHEVD